VVGAKVPLNNYLFQYQQKDPSDSNSLYEGWLSLSYEPETANTTNYFIAGTVNVD